jgi:hypothetical protein
MLIKVFGYWINPRNVTCLHFHIGTGATRICFNVTEYDAADYIEIEGATPDQVAEEINKQATANL